MASDSLCLDLPICKLELDLELVGKGNILGNTCNLNEKREDIWHNGWVKKKKYQWNQVFLGEFVDLNYGPIL